MAG
ncbi:hypothetical protein ECEC1845_5708, partial [Escherichia coli EC1845]|jgi:hypothetical protein